MKSVQLNERHSVIPVLFLQKAKIRIQLHKLLEKQFIDVLIFHKHSSTLNFLFLIKL